MKTRKNVLGQLLITVILPFGELLAFWRIDKFKEGLFRSLVTLAIVTVPIFVTIVLSFIPQSGIMFYGQEAMMISSMVSLGRIIYLLYLVGSWTSKHNKNVESLDTPDKKES